MALKPEHDAGDLNPTAVTAAKESDGEIRRLTLDDDDQLRVIAALLMDTLGRTLAEWLGDIKDRMDEILLELRLANYQRAEMGGLNITRTDVEGEPR